jgi:thiamine-phosphate pyrophosphorylase
VGKAVILSSSETFFKSLPLYIITDRKLVEGAQFLPALENVLKAGARCIQLREKDLNGEDLCVLAREVKKRIDAYKGFLFINDRADLAHELGATGVHLTETSLPVREVKKKYPELKIGVSTHSLERARDVEAQGADFITYGPVYATPSKMQYGSPQGIDRLSEVAHIVSLPVLALGGVKVSNLAEIKKTGAHGIALISAIWAGSDIYKNTLEFSNILLRGQDS